MQRRKKYSSEYKQEAVALAERKGNTQASLDLGINPSVLYQWHRNYLDAAEKGIKVFPGQGNPKDEDLHALRKRVADLEEENEILKKAAVIFAKEKTR